jgi:cystathionine beta-lyase
LTGPARGGTWTTRKWEVRRPEIGAWIAESDFGTAPAVTAALHQAVERGFLTYLPDHAAAAAEAACSTFLHRRHGWAVPADRVHLVPDVVAALRITMDHFVGPDAAIAVPTPCYPPFLTAPARLGRRVIQVPSARIGDRWRIDADALASAFADGARLLLLCNPHNPLGQVMTIEEQEEVAAVVERFGARVFSDEIHAPVVYEGARHHPYAALSPATAAHTVTATATSKGWNIPGLKSAQLILTSDADQETWLRRDIVPALEGSILGAVAARVAYTEGVAWLDEMIRVFDGNRRLVGALLAEHAPDVGYTMPEATYLAWLDFSAFGLDDDVARFLRAEAGVVASSGTDTGQGGEGFVRFNFAMAPHLLERSVAAIGRSLRRPRRRDRDGGSTLAATG